MHAPGMHAPGVEQMQAGLRFGFNQTHFGLGGSRRQGSCSCCSNIRFNQLKFCPPPSLAMFPLCLDHFHAFLYTTHTREDTE